MSARAQSARFNPATVKAAVESAKTTDAPPMLTPPPVSEDSGDKTPKKSARGKDKDKSEEGSKSPRLKTSKSSKKLKDEKDEPKADKSNDGPAAGAEPAKDDKKSPREKKPESPKGESKKARALFDYDAADETEISFKTDDIILVVPSADPMEGWLEGEINGNRGLFPENYVELVGEEAAEPAETKPAASGTARLCLALYDFVAENEDELTIKEGEELMVEEESDGWCTGTNKDGKTGLFPANYVEEKK
jgi:drebrin-like protein